MRFTWVFIFTSAFCFSQMTAYWPMWLSKLITYSSAEIQGENQKYDRYYTDALIRSLYVVNSWWFEACCWSGDCWSCACMCRTYSGFDLLGAVGIFESVVRIFIEERGRADVCDHHSSAVSTERVFEESCQLAISVRNMCLLTLRIKNKPKQRKIKFKNITKERQRHTRKNDWKIKLIQPSNTRQRLHD